MSLRGRFVVASSVVTLLTSCGASAGVWLAYEATQERQLDAALLSEATGDALDAGARDPRGGSLPLRHWDLAPIDEYAVLYDGAGVPEAWTRNLEGGRPRIDGARATLGAPFDQWWNNRHLRGVRVPVPGDRGESLLLATSREDLDGDAAYLARRMAAATLLGAVVAAAITAWAARFLTRDHERIAAVARAVAAGDLSARVGLASDDPDLGRLGRDVDEMISRLAILVETQGRFIASASHELRSPITTMLAELSFAVRRERDAAAYREAVEAALDSTRRLRRLTDDLLALARVAATETCADRVRIGEVARAAIHAARSDARAAGVCVEGPADDVTVEGSAPDLERMVRNLVENAVRHSAAGGCVRVDVACDGREASLSVSDDGPGVPAEQRERIFEPFYRGASEPDHPGGAGLGLAIARSIARAHRGDVRAEDPTPGARGARFVARLPVAVAGAGGRP